MINGLVDVGAISQIVIIVVLDVQISFVQKIVKSELVINMGKCPVCESELEYLLNITEEEVTRQFDGEDYIQSDIEPMQNGKEWFECPFCIHRIAKTEAQAKRLLKRSE